MKIVISLMLLTLLTTSTFANVTAIDMAKTLIKQSLRDPSSVQFENITEVENTKGQKSICGKYNAKNIYGGYVGFKEFTADSKTGEIIAFGNHNDYKLAGCAGQLVEIETIKEVNRLAEVKRVSGICDAQQAFILSVISDKKSHIEAYEKLMKSDKITETDLLTLDQYVKALNEVESNKEYVRVLRFYPHGDFIKSNRYLREIRDSCFKEHTKVNNNSLD